MKKLTIIRLKEAGRSNRSIERELGIGRKTFARYWKKHLDLIDSIKMNPSDPEAKAQIVEAPRYQVGNQSKRKYTPEIDAHIHFFSSVGGIYDNIVYYNMKNVVKCFIGRHEKELNDEFIKLSLFYGFTPESQTLTVETKKDMPKKV